MMDKHINTMWNEYAPICIKYPSTGIALGAHILVASINFIFMATNYDILPLDFTIFPIELSRTHEIAQREAAWSARNSHPESITRFTLEDIGPSWPRGHTVDELVLYYTRGVADGNVFVRETFVQMRDIEDAVYDVKDYQDVYCQLNEAQTCVKPRSLIRYFDGSLVNTSSVFYDPEFNNINAVLYEAYTNPATAGDFVFFLGHGYTITARESSSNVTRTSIAIGWPISGDGTDREKRDMVNAFQQEHFKPILEEANGQTSNGLEMFYFSWFLFSEDVQGQAFKDMALAIGSLAFIFGFIWLQTKSLWITGWAVFSIITSFMITNLIYRTVLNYQYFGYLNIISIFIILGIGADDIFVFVNTWRATEFEEYPSTAHRLSDCYRTAALAMFFTSFTTMAAFLIGGISPVLPIGSFGIFTGILIAVNYISVIIYFPAVVIMHHTYFEKRCCPCESCPSCPSRRQSQHVTKGKGPFGLRPSEVVPTDSKAPAKPSIIVRFFRGPYFKFVTHPVVRWVIIAIFLVIIGFFIWSATRLEVDSEEV